VNGKHTNIARLSFIAVIAAIIALFWQSEAHAQSRRELAEELRRQHRPLSALEIESQFVPIGELAPDLNGILALGDSSAAFHPNSKLLILDFWFAECSYCRDMSHALSRIDSIYRPRGLSVLAVDPYDWDTSKIEKFWRREHPTYPGLMVTHEAELDYGIYSYPMIYVLDERRHVIFRQVGFSPNQVQQLEQFLKARLQ
jgi:hypothetical protein